MVKWLDHRAYQMYFGDQIPRDAMFFGITVFIIICSGFFPSFRVLYICLSEPEFYGDLVYKFKQIAGRADFSDQFRKIIVRYKRIGYNINIMRQSACLMFNSITVNNLASLFNCTPVGRASDSMMAPT